MDILMFYSRVRCMKLGTDRECAPRVAHIVTSLNQGGAQSMLVKLLSARREGSICMSFP